MAISLVDETYDRLLSMIVSEQLKPGDRLPSESVLCEQFNVSRNTLRAALNKMLTLGITESRRGGGTYLKAVNSDAYLNFFVPATLTHNMDLLEVMQFRKGIEVEAARLAAENADEDDIRELNILLNECMKSSEDANMKSFALSNTNFHVMVAAASHNKMLESMMKIVRSIIVPEMQNFLLAQGKDVDSTFYHSMILRCIIEHKPDEAAFFMDRHSSLVINRVREYENEKN